MTIKDELARDLEQQPEAEIWREDEQFGADDDPIRKRQPQRDDDWLVEAGLDTEDVHLEGVEGAEEEPSWVIRNHYTEEELGTIKSGKEADVVLVRRASGPRSCLLAVKRYRPRAQRAFRREEDYRAGQGTGDERVDRALGKRTRFGRQVLEYAWAYREFPLMRTAWRTGARVPYPVEALSEGLAMQYIGNEEAAAPRLAEIRLSGEEAQRAFESVILDIRKLLDAYLVHGDLSAYNVLYWDGRPWLIDFPQAVDIARSQRGIEFLRRDIHNVCKHFARWGVDADEGALFDDVMRDSPFAWLG
ncbi:MAG TPA: RIO1 family regulatory kinase/ATPase [Actinomycetota bacterium]|nr:RIO1 family regulatory kinase/ATPase [Actinomycetota bacterium]